MVVVVCGGEDAAILAITHQSLSASSYNKLFNSAREQSIRLGRAYKMQSTRTINQWVALLVVIISSSSAQHAFDGMSKLSIYAMIIIIIIKDFGSARVRRRDGLYLFNFYADETFRANICICT